MTLKFSDTAPSYGGYGHGDVALVKSVETAQREDLVVYRTASGHSFARVMALPGEKLTIGQDRFFVDNNPIEFRYLDNTPNSAAFHTQTEQAHFRLAADDDGANMKPWSVPANDVTGVFEVVFSSKQIVKNQFYVVSLGICSVLVAFTAPLLLRRAMGLRFLPNIFGSTVYVLFFSMPVFAIVRESGLSFSSIAAVFGALSISLYNFVGSWFGLFASLNSV